MEPKMHKLHEYKDWRRGFSFDGYRFMFIYTSSSYNLEKQKHIGK